MMNLQREIHPNLKMLEFVARKLQMLRDDLVFLGGCSTSLIVDDPDAPVVRTTEDVDCIVDVISLAQYHRLSERLNAFGFKQSMQDAVICRWRCEGIILDVMPADRTILGFGNRWYKSAIKRTITHVIAENISLKSVTAPYFLATKWEAFVDRGRNDYLMSHDFEDIITVMDGRLSLIEEVKSADFEVQQYLAAKCFESLQDPFFKKYLPGHLNYSVLTRIRADRIISRMQQLADFSKN